MKKWVSWLAPIIVLSCGLHLLELWLMPYGIMKIAAKKLSIKVNTVAHSEPIDATFRRVVSPSPDLLYSVCGFDVSQQPLKIIAAVPPETYFSISGFGSNTDNFFALNDQDFQSDQVEIILASRDFVLPDSINSKIIRSPSPTGIVLFRSLIKDTDKIDDLIHYQKQSSCTPIVKI